MTWIPLLRYHNGPRLFSRAAVLLRQRLYVTYSSRQNMIPLHAIQRALHVQAGLPPVEEEGITSHPCFAHASTAGAPVAPQHGYIELIFGPMFAGKTTELLRRVEQQQRRGLKVAVVKSAKDNRYDLSHVVTHDGLRQPCYSVPSLADFKRAAGQDYHSFQVIAIDEAQFFGDLVDFCAAAADHEAKHVIVAGLDGDFQRRRFGQILDVIPFADTVTKLTARCTFCHKDEEERQHKQQQQLQQQVAGGPSVLDSSHRTPLREATNHQPPQRHHRGSAASGSLPGPLNTAAASATGAGSADGKHLVHGQAVAEAEAGSVQRHGLRPALFSLRIAADDQQEVVGGADKYVPVCRHHYMRLSEVRAVDSDAEDGSPGKEAAQAVDGGC